MNKALIVGASGATGRLLVAELLQRDVQVVAITRSISSMNEKFREIANYHEESASVSELSVGDLSKLLKDCDAVLSCLGHNITFKGMFGKPRRLVKDTLVKVSQAIESLEPKRNVKIVLMNTTGNANRDIPEKPPFSQRLVVFLLRYLLPPHADNEQAADFLRTSIGQNHRDIEWAAVRPDGLIDAPEVSSYTNHPSPTRNAIFDAGETSRINVANFMARLVTEPDLWTQWKGKMPVIYND